MTTDIKQTSFWQKSPYAVLARLDRPVGYWLLYWPCVWSLALAPTFKTLAIEAQACFLLLFFIGAVVMRSAGCVVNDIFDRKLDAQVERTKARPLASGKISVTGAIIFLGALLAVGAAILFQLSATAIIIGLCTLPLIAIYPLMKRVTFLPQLVLGIVFNAGALIGWAAMENALALAPILLYLAAIAWTVAYDTIYAFMDAKDDSMIGIKSTALLWGLAAKVWTGWLFVAAHILFIAALIVAGATWVSYLFAVLSLFMSLWAHMSWKITNDAYTLNYFRLQVKIGFILALSALAPTLF
jgi:4-hydroxybenzoate polyprenyltransferase